MELFRNVLSVLAILIGCGFFLAGTVGVIRFPDVFTRLHALTKADNVGLGFMVAGLAVQADDLVTLVQLFLVWFLVLLSSASSSHLLARSVLKRGGKPWQTSQR